MSVAFEGNFSGRATTRWRLHRWCAAALPLLASIAAGCADPQGYDLRRFPFVVGRAPAGESRPPTILVTGGVSRPGLRLPESASAATAVLHDLTAGRLVVHVAPAGEAVYGGGASVVLRETGFLGAVGLGLKATCDFHWGLAGTAGDPPWESCVFHLPRSVASATVEVSRRGGTGGELLLADLHATGNVRSPRPHVFVLVLDAARFDRLRPFAPRNVDVPIGSALEALARDSILLRELRSASSWTRPAVATLLTGRRADRHRVHGRGDKLAEGFTTVPELLREHGYSTWAWSANPNVLPLWGFGQGFDAFVDQGSQAWIQAKTDGSELLDRLKAALAARGPESGLYYLHLMDPHAPYVPSEEQLASVSAIPRVVSLFPRPPAAITAPQDWKAFRSYLGELLDTDAHIAAFVKLLRDERLYDDALVLVVADHGEEFLDHGGRDHGRTLYEEVLRVPGLVKLPGNLHGGSVLEQPVSFEDLAPTLLDALGLDPPGDIDGRVLPLAGEAELAPRPHVATLRLDGRRQMAIVEPPWKLVHYEGVGITEVFNLAEDPLERRNLFGSEQDRAAAMTAALRSALRRGQEGWHVLFCGSSGEDRVEVLLRAPGGEPALHGFEPEEVTRPDSATGSWRLSPVLAPRMLPQVGIGRIVEVATPDQAEVVIPPLPGQLDPTLEIVGRDGVPFRYRLGTDAAPVAAPRLELRALQPEVLADATARIECTGSSGAGEAEAPFLRVWYVAAAESLGDEDLDPALRERLRALGYLD